jgi:hypothetical protein
MKWFALPSFAAVVVAAVVCAPSCSSAESTCVRYCEDHKECREVDDDWRFVSCDEVCAFLDEIATKSGCDAPFEAYTECVGEAPDVCEDDDVFDVDSCDDQWEAFEDCSARFCQQHRDACDPFGRTVEVSEGTGTSPPPPPPR